MQRIEKREDTRSSFPLYAKPLKPWNIHAYCELGNYIYQLLMQHPQVDHNYHKVLDNELAMVNLLEFDGDYNIEISVPSLAYEAAVFKGTGEEKRAHSVEPT